MACRKRRSDTPLHSAIRSYDRKIRPVKTLLKKHDINIRNPAGETPLHVAVQNGRCSKQLITLLLENGADVNATTPRGGNTALHLLAMNANIDVESHQLYEVGLTLLENGGDINVRNSEGCIPLHLALLAESEFETLFMQLLFRHKSDVNASNSKGDTPLHLYLQRNNEPLFLADYLANVRDVNVVNSKGETPLHLAARNKKSCKLMYIKFLLDHGADVCITDARDQNAYEAYCYAIEEDNTGKRVFDPMLSQMLLYGNALMQRVNSSLHVACLFHDVDSVHRMLKLGADVNAIDAFDHPPLYYAITVASKDEEDLDNKCTTLKLLLDYGADVTELRQKRKRDFNSLVNSLLFLGLFSSFHFERRSIDRDRVSCLPAIFIQHVAELMTLQEKQVERGIDVKLLIESNDLVMVLLLDNEATIVRPEIGYKASLSRCSEEMKTMSDTVIGESRVSFFDLLVASAKKTAIYAKNKELVKAFHAKKAMFPMYQGMLDAKIDKALERRKLVESAAVSLSDALEFGDPSDEFYERTLSYCSNKDLIRLIG